MCEAFPSVSTLSLKDARPGSIVKIPRFDGPILALVTDHFTKDVRSFVVLTMGNNGPSPLFAENWRNEESALSFNDSARFELGIADNEIDARGDKWWDVAGIIVSIGNELYIRAAPQDNFYGQHKLINIQNGSVYPDREPVKKWSFSSWKLWLRDSFTDGHLLLLEFKHKEKLT